MENTYYICKTLRINQVGVVHLQSWHYVLPFEPRKKHWTSQNYLDIHEFYFYTIVAILQKAIQKPWLAHPHSSLRTIDLTLLECSMHTSKCHTSQKLFYTIKKHCWYDNSTFLDGWQLRITYWNVLNRIDCFRLSTIEIFVLK